LISLALVAGLTLMNVQAVELHVHATADHIDNDHHHGPSSHHHDAIDHHLADTTRVAAPDAADTVVHVALAAASGPSIKLFHPGHDAPACDGEVASIVTGSPIVARAHGPPSIDQHSLRAPPTILSL